MTPAFRPAALCAALLAAPLAAPALAQDAGAFAATSALFDPTGPGASPTQMLEASAALLDGIEGRWFAAPQLGRDDMSAQTIIAFMERGCDPDRPLLSTVTRLTPFAFEVARSRTSDEGTFVYRVRYDNTLRNAFQPGYDVIEQAAFFGGSDPETLERLLPTIALDTTQRLPVALYRPDADTFVMAAIGAVPQIFLRCP